MKCIVEKVLKEKEFRIDKDLFEDERVFQAERINKSAFDFLTVFQLDYNHLCEKDLSASIDQFYKDLSEKKGDVVGIDKNISLLILLKVETLEYTPEIQSLIFDVEENPYTFKKNILTYTGKQEELLISMLKGTNDNVISILYKILYDKEKFAKFKKGSSSEEFLAYDLVSKMFIKIPFLSVKNQYENIDSLSTEILSSLGDDRRTWDAFMELIEQESTDVSIRKILSIAEGYDNE